MIPKKVQKNFKTICEKNDDDFNVEEGMLECCGAHNFEMLVTGEIKFGLFSNMSALPSANNELIIQARCKKCGKIILVFDSRCDGYDQCESGNSTSVSSQNHVPCKKCHANDFFAHIKYEYPPIEELNELGVKHVDNAFTWIQITLECNNCGAKYKKFVDFETA